MASSRSSRHLLRKIALGAALGFLLLLIAFRMLAPDPSGRLLFARAQRLEANGLVQPALHQYLLLARAHPRSPLAAQALWQAAELQTDLAKAGDARAFGAARDTYAHLAETYYQSPMAPDALLRAGEISVEPLHQWSLAQSLFERVLNEYSDTHKAQAARATLGLGRVAQGRLQRDVAKRWYERVLQRFPGERETCAEAQFRLGETSETLFKEHPLWARTAYDAVIRTYPTSPWAARAKERLGMLLYSAPPRERRVLVEMKYLPDESAGSQLLDALRMVLTARGIEATPSLMNALTLAPFYAGFRPDDPARAVAMSGEQFENAVANAGLTYDIEDGPDFVKATRSLQREVDAGSAVLVFLERWRFVAGYDSARGEVFLQNGAQVSSIALPELSRRWYSRAPGAGRYAMMSFRSSGEVAQSRILPPGQKTLAAPKPLRPTPTPSAGNAVSAPTPTPSPTPKMFAPQLSALGPPTYAITLTTLDEKAMHFRIARAAAALMRRARSGEAYLNIEGLYALSDALARASHSSQNLSTQNRSALPLPPDTNQLPPPALPSEPPVRQQEDEASNALTSPQPISFRSLSTQRAALLVAQVAPLPSASPQATPEARPSPAPPNATDRKATAPTAKPNKTVPRPFPRPRPPALPPSEIQRRRLRNWSTNAAAQWIGMRRQAAAYLDEAAARTGETSLRDAAAAFRQSARALEEAALVLRGLAPKPEYSGNEFARATPFINAAIEAETRATQLLAQSGAPKKAAPAAR